MSFKQRFKKVPAIYVIRNTLNNKCYVGESVDLPSRLRAHRSYGKLLIGKAIKKYGPENFDVKVTYYPAADKADLLKIEEELIAKLGTLSPLGYNQIPSTKLSSQEWRVKRGLTKKPRVPKTEEHQRKITEALTGRVNGPLSEEHKRRISEKNKGRKPSKEEIEKMRQALLGSKRTEESKKRMSAAQYKSWETRKRTLTEEHRRKISEGGKRRYANKDV